MSMTHRFKENFKDIFGELYVAAYNDYEAIGDIENRLTALVENEIDSLQTEIRNKTQEYYTQGVKSRDTFEREMQTLRNQFIFDKNVISTKHTQELERLRDTNKELLSDADQHQAEIKHLKGEVRNWRDNYYELKDLYHTVTNELEHRADQIADKFKDVPDFSTITFVPSVPHKVEEVKTEQISVDYSPDLSKIEALKF